MSQKTAQALGILVVDHKETVRTAIAEVIAPVSNVVRRAAEKIELEWKTDRLIEMLKQKTEQLEKSNAQLHSLAIRDNLTGLYNHRYFQESLKAELNRAQRYQRQFSLLFIDLDYFKTYNDTQGHLRGDRLLIDLSNLFLTCFRKSDIICRYGGDEFAVILPETSRQKACITAATLHARVADHPFYGREAMPHGRVTASIGFATYPDHDADVEGLLHHADRFMYEAKKNRGQFSAPAETSATGGCSTKY
jgi:diguanylate cyclase (GGDEF)-like protein